MRGFQSKTEFKESGMRSCGFRVSVSRLFSFVAVLLLIVPAAVAGEKKPAPHELELQVIRPILLQVANRSTTASLPVEPNACTILTASCNTSVAGGLFPGDCTSSTDARYFDPYDISLAAGTTITISATAEGALDPLLIVLTSTGEVVAGDDDSGGGVNARVSFTVPSTGTYTIVVTPATASGFGSYNLTITCSGSTPPPSTGSCTPNSTTLCLSNNRFRVQVAWTAPDGRTGNGQVVPFGSPDSGLFWFFDANNWEMLIKMINACSFNNRYWVYGAATTDVGYTITVTDTKTGSQRQYTNPQGNRAPAITDGNAFATCP